MAAVDRSFPVIRWAGKRPAAPALLVVWIMALLSGAAAFAQSPQTVTVEAIMAADRIEVDGTVEAVRSATIAAQVAGEIQANDLQAGRRVRAGEILLRLDDEAALRAQAGAEAQAGEIRADLALARAEFKRKQALYERQYISRAAYEQALARRQAAEARLAAQQAQVSAVGIQADHFLIRSPYDGIVASIEAEPGDMAMPGRPLLTIFDPSSLRLSAQIPQHLIPRLDRQARIHWPRDLAEGLPDVLPIEVLPTRHNHSLTGTIRLALPAAVTGLAPGMPVRLSLDVPGSVRERLRIPASAVLRRGELIGAYVLTDEGVIQLRQIRTGPTRGPWTEVLSGLRAGERVLRHPAQYAAGA